MAGHDYPNKRDSSSVTTVKERNETNKHVGGETSMASVESMRVKPGAELGTPRLLHASLQMNLRRRRDASADAKSPRCVRVPIAMDAKLP